MPKDYRFPGVFEAFDYELLYLIFRNGSEYTFLTHPSRSDIVQTLKEHDLDVDAVFNLIESRDPKVHTIEFNVPVFRQHLKDT